MHGKKASVTWSILHSIGDTIEEDILLNYHENSYLFWMNLVTGIITILFSIFGGLEMSFVSFFFNYVYMCMFVCVSMSV